MRFKLTIIGLFLLLIVKFSFTQTYFDNNPLWRISSICLTDAYCFNYNDYNYFVGGDTIIYSHIYKKLYMYGVGYHDWIGPQPIPQSCQGYFTIGSTDVPFNYIRDTLNLIYTVGNPEHCLYDFNLNVGDTLPICYGTSNQTVLSIDSLLVNGNYRKQFHLSHSGGESQIIIEGIGHDQGFLEGLPPLLDGCANQLVCYSVNNVSYYPNGNLDCHFTNAVTELNNNSLKIHPNPAHKYIFIEPNNLFVKNITLIDLIGRSYVLAEVKGIDSVYRIDIPDLSDGYYYLSIITNLGTVNKPIVINNNH